MNREWAGHTETHVSAVYFVGDFALKILKPLKLPFLDHSTLPRRHAAAIAEVTLNRRLAPDVYLGVTALQSDEKVVDYAIVMRRMPEERRLSSLVGSLDFDDRLRAVAKDVASFHSTLASDEEAVQIASIPSERVRWYDNLSELGELASRLGLDSADIDRVGGLADEYLEHRDPLFAQRAADGLCREGHGDLLADDIFCLEDGPRILDCLAFSTELRKGDVLADIAFLVMDIERIAGAAEAQQLLHWYQEFGNEHHPASLADFYIAYRALVRAKVTALRHVQTGDRSDANEAVRLFTLCVRHLERAKPRIVLIGGGPGSGKTTLSDSVGQQLGWVVLSSDEIRKERAGLDPREHRFSDPDQGLYEPAVTDQTYAALCSRAAVLVGLGESVVLDASWSRGHHRAAARGIGERAGAEVVEIECRLDPIIARERVSARLGSAPTTSDARPVIVDHLARQRSEWPEAIAIDATRSPAECRAKVVGLLMNGHRSTGALGEASAREGSRGQPSGNPGG